jgi:hypothetical protein
MRVRGTAISSRSHIATNTGLEDGKAFFGDTASLRVPHISKPEVISKFGYSIQQNALHLKLAVVHICV